MINICDIKNIERLVMKRKFDTVYGVKGFYKNKEVAGISSSINSSMKKAEINLLDYVNNKL